MLSIEGDEATGKTTLAYSAPLPIVGFAYDMGIERAIKENKQIKGELKKCGYNLAMEGTVLANPTWDSVANLVAMGTGDRIEVDRRNHS